MRARLLGGMGVPRDQHKRYQHDRMESIDDVGTLPENP